MKRPRLSPENGAKFFTGGIRAFWGDGRTMPAQGDGTAT